MTEFIKFKSSNQKKSKWNFALREFSPVPISVNILETDSETKEV